MKYTVEDLEGIIEKMLHACELTKREKRIAERISEHEGDQTSGVVVHYIKRKLSQELAPEEEKSEYFLTRNGKVVQVRTLKLDKEEIKEVFG